MHLVDLNLLLYATNRSAPHHQQANAWFAALMTGGSTVALPLACQVGFVRLATNPRVVERPLSPGEATDIVKGWLDHPSVVTPSPTSRHFEILRHLLEATGVGGNLVSDAHLAALAIEHGATLHSADNDFGRFPGLEWRNPLV